MICLPDGAYHSGKYWSDSVQMVSGCTRVSDGCANCWALAMEERFDRAGDPTFHASRLPRLVSGKGGRVMAIWNDLFHEAVSFEQIWQTISTCRQRPDIQYLILTKRAARMCSVVAEIATAASVDVLGDNLWFGVSVEDQGTTTARVPFLRAARVSRRFVSVEPIIRGVGLLPALLGFDWVIVGSETGPGARLDADTNTRVSKVVRACKAAQVPVWVKGVTVIRKGKLATSHEPGDWHPSLRVREVPGKDGHGRQSDVGAGGVTLFDSVPEA